MLPSCFVGPVTRQPREPRRWENGGLWRIKKERQVISLCLFVYNASLMHLLMSEFLSVPFCQTLWVRLIAIDLTEFEQNFNIEQLWRWFIVDPPWVWGALLIVEVTHHWADSLEGCPRLRQLYLEPSDWNELQQERWNKKNKKINAFWYEKHMEQQDQQEP